MTRFFFSAAAAFSVAAALLIFGPSLVGPASAQGVGEISRDPVRTIERELAEDCGGGRLADQDILIEDISDDGLDDVILRVAVPCRGATNYFCGTRGCRAEVWIAEGPGRFRKTNDLVAQELTIIPWYEGPALQINRGPVWVWDGERMARASATGAGGGAARPRDDGWTDPDRPAAGGSVTDDWDEPLDEQAGFEEDGWSNPDLPQDLPQDLPRENDGWTSPDDARSSDLPPPPSAPTPGVWSVDEVRPGVFRAFVNTGDDVRDGRLAVRCRPGDETLTLAVLPDAIGQERLVAVRGAQQVLDIDVDRRIIETRLLTRARRADGPLTDPGLLPFSPVMSALIRGSRVEIRDGGNGETLLSAPLRGSSRALNALRDACGL